MRTARTTPLYAVLALLVVSSMLLQVALGSVFVYRWLGSTATVSPPVVYFADPGTPGVNVNLYNYGTTGDVYVNANIDLVLENRSAIYFNTFDTIPQDLFVLTCQLWYYIPPPYGGAVAIAANQSAGTSYGGECIAFANVDISQYATAGRTVYVAFLVWRSGFNYATANLGTHRFDSVYVNTAQQTLYTIGLQDIVLEGRTGDYINSTIYYYSGATGFVQLGYSSLGTSNVTESYYLAYVASAVDFSSWRAIHWFNGSVLTSVAIGSSYRMYPNIVGLGYWTNTTSVNGFVYFDNLVITVDTPPWFINITGLPSGWRVVLKNSTGGVVSQAVADSSGLAVLNAAPPQYVDLTADPNFRNGFIFPSATMEVYDWSGNLVLSKAFDYVVGGDLYRFLGFNGNLLRVDSTLTGSSFEAKLVLVNTNCSSIPWWLYLYLVNTSNYYSTPINITAGAVYSSETSAIVMTAGSGGATGYVYGYTFIPQGYICEAVVELRYSFSGWATYGSLRARLFFRG